MKQRQTGTIERRAVLLLVLLGVLSVFAISHMSSFSNQSNMTAAYRFASESKLRLSEFYMLSSRFPSTEYEIRSVTTASVQAPHFVSRVVLEEQQEDYDVIVKVYLKEDVVASTSGEEPYIFMAANRSRHAPAGLEWSCGASGVDAELLPGECSS